MAIRLISQSSPSVPTKAPSQEHGGVCSRPVEFWLVLRRRPAPAPSTASCHDSKWDPPRPTPPLSLMLPSFRSWLVAVQYSHRPMGGHAVVRVLFPVDQPHQVTPKPTDLVGCPP